MLVTTSYHPSPAEHEQAKRLAQRLQCPFIPRKETSIPKLRRQHQSPDVLVITTKGLRYFPEGAAEPFFFHPSTSQIRIKRMLRGEPDALIETAGAEAGDTILDCTAGLGSDSILFSYAVGEQGRVIAVESEPLVALLIEEGLRSYESGVPELDAAMRRIEVVQGDHGPYLKELGDRSVDIVYFDPMFREPIGGSSSISPLREIANDRALSPESVREACRAARKRVLLKEHRDGPEYERLGFRRIERPYTKIAYGVIDL